MLELQNCDTVGCPPSLDFLSWLDPESYLFLCDPPSGACLGSALTTSLWISPGGAGLGAFCLGFRV